jgi:hypothetical protein
MTPRDALAELRRCAGTQFDPRVVRAFQDTLYGAPDAGAGNGAQPSHDGTRGMPAAAATGAPNRPVADRQTGGRR